MKKLLLSLSMLVVLAWPATAHALYADCKDVIKQTGQTLKQCQCEQSMVPDNVVVMNGQKAPDFDRMYADAHRQCMSEDHTVAIWAGVAAGTALLVLWLTLHKKKHPAKAKRSRRKK